jgi:alkanesulfonate monooxygenase SsuD/methylene tetrahydromethanopterin reductase-like flavin-dependent oxidoreductase (luciferase family)
MSTTSSPDAAPKFGLDDHMEHGDCYARAREYYDLVMGQWTASLRIPSSAERHAWSINRPAHPADSDHALHSIVETDINSPSLDIENNVLIMCYSSRKASLTVAPR